MSLPRVQLSRVPELREQLSVSKKRKRDDTGRGEQDAEPNIDRRPFLVKPAGSDPFAKTKTFTPLRVIMRNQLPLTWRDTAGAGSQLFAADVRLLEALHDAGEEQWVLVVQEKDDGCLYALERTARRVYALCRLGLWVSVQGLEDLSTRNLEQDGRVAVSYTHLTLPTKRIV